MDEGHVLADRYELGPVLGSGGMATVHRARDRVLNRDVAVKILSPVLASDAEALARFDREAKSAAALNHPGIVQVYDTGVQGRTHFLVMELVDGPTLAHVLRNGPLPPDRVARIGEDVCRALAHAHERGIVHRDVKPGNLLLTERGVRIADFGIARAAESPNVTRTGVLVGTASYLSPEQARGLPAQPRSDLYSLGCTLYEALTGAPPFTGGTATSVAVRHMSEPPLPPRGVPGPLSAVVMRALAKEPSDRFPTADAMGDALAAASGSDETLPIAVAPTETLPAAGSTMILGPRTTRERVPARPPRRRPSVVPWLVGAAVVLLVVAALLTSRNTSEPTPAPAQAPAIVEEELPATPAPPPTPTAEPATPEPTPEPTPRHPVLMSADQLRASVDEGEQAGEITTEAAGELSDRVDTIVQEFGEGDGDEAVKKADELRDRLREMQKDDAIDTGRYVELRARTEDLRRELRRWSDD